MKIILFNRHDSPNLGHGVIADGMTDWIRRLGPEADVVSVDFSGRSGLGDETYRGRTLALSVRRRLPALLRQQIVLARLTPRAPCA